MPDIKDFIAETEAKFAAEAQATGSTATGSALQNPPPYRFGPGPDFLSKPDLRPGAPNYGPAPEDKATRLLALIEKLTDCLNLELTRRT
jgi:hypothetical protein